MVKASRPKADWGPALKENQTGKYAMPPPDYEVFTTDGSVRKRTLPDGYTNHGFEGVTGL